MIPVGVGDYVSFPMMSADYKTEVIRRRMVFPHMSAFGKFVYLSVKSRFFQLFAWHLVLPFHSAACTVS